MSPLSGEDNHASNGSSRDISTDESNDKAVSAKHIENNPDCTSRRDMTSHTNISNHTIDNDPETLFPNIGPPPEQDHNDTNGKTDIPPNFPNLDGVDDFEDDNPIPGCFSLTPAGPAAPRDDGSVSSYGSRQSKISNISSLFQGSILGGSRLSFFGGRRGSFRSSKRESMVEHFKKQAGRPLDQRAKSERIFAICAGICLAFNSGYINGCCMSGLLTEAGSVEQGVSAFTGAYTKAGLRLAEGDAGFFGFEVGMISSFIGGACISALINPRPTPWQLGPTYGPTFLLGAALVAVSSILSSTHPEGKSLFFFAAAANGLQNGMSSMYSANLIRTSHLTGTSTDIGLFLGQILRGNFANAFKFGVLVSLALSFWSGAFVSFYAVSKARGHALIFNAVFFLLLGILCIVFVILTNKVTIWQAVTGNWHWKRALDALNVPDQMHAGDEEAILEIFDKLDVDGDGNLEADELYLALSASGMRVTKKGAQALIQIGDGDGDGRISRAEWVELMRKNAANAADERGKMSGSV